MRLELRSSGGALCEKCGATELLHTAGTREAFIAELHEFLLAPGENGDVVDTDKEKIATLVDGFDKYLNGDISRLRFLKRRYRDELRGELERQTEALMGRTHLF